MTRATVASPWPLPDHRFRPASAGPIASANQVTERKDLRNTGESDNVRIARSDCERRHSFDQPKLRLAFRCSQSVVKWFVADFFLTAEASGDNQLRAGDRLPPSRPVVCLSLRKRD